MTKSSAGIFSTRESKPATEATQDSAKRAKPAHRLQKTERIVVSKARFEAVMRAAEQSGLLSEKGGRIGGRVSPALVRQAKRQTGIETDTDLIAFALASVALEDDFADMFRESRGKVDPALKLGF